MFFKDTEDFKNYFQVTASFSFEQLSAYLRQVDSTVLVKYLGSAFVADLQDKYDKSIQKDPSKLPEALTGKYVQLIELIRICTPNYAMLKWLPTGQVQIDNGGIKITSTTTHKQAWEWQVIKLENALLEGGLIGLEEILKYLEENIDDFTAYKSSAEYKANRSLFVNTSEQMATHFSAMNCARVNFFLFKSILKKVEIFDIKPILLPDLFNDLKAKLDSENPLSDEYKALLECIRPAVVHLTIARAVNELAARVSADGFLIFDNTSGRESLKTRKTAPENTLNKMQLAAESDGKTYLADLKAFLEANKEDYPLYANDPQYKTYTTGVIAQDPNNSFYSAL